MRSEGQNFINKWLLRVGAKALGHEEGYSINSNAIPVNMIVNGSIVDEAFGNDLV